MRRLAVWLLCAVAGSAGAQTIKGVGIGIAAQSDSRWNEQSHLGPALSVFAARRPTARFGLRTDALIATFGPSSQGNLYSPCPPAVAANSTAANPCVAPQRGRITTFSASAGALVYDDASVRGESGSYYLFEMGAISPIQHPEHIHPVLIAYSAGLGLETHWGKHRGAVEARYQWGRGFIGGYYAMLPVTLVWTW